MYATFGFFFINAADILACEAQTYFRLSLLSLREATSGNMSALRRLLTSQQLSETRHMSGIKQLGILPLSLPSPRVLPTMAFKGRLCQKTGYLFQTSGI